MTMPRLLPAYRAPDQQEESRAVLVPSIRESVHRWRRDGHPGVTATTEALLRHWFASDHEVEESGESWAYYYCQQEAVETTVYLFEVLKKRNFYELAREFATDSDQQLSFDPREDRWVRYAYKMATGSGKTKVMSLLVAWSYFNALRESAEVASDYSKTFLVLAPNVIVYERLKQDFGDNGKIFREDPVIPPEWRDDWQVEIVTRDDPSDSVNRDGALFLTNVQQMYDRARSQSTREPQPLRDVIGDPVVDSDVSAGRMIRQALERRGDLMVLNDEGHHVHDSSLRWWETIQGLDESLRNRTGRGLRGQLDFSATPKHTDGRLFNHVIVDYPIAQAIADGVVKRPHLVMLKGATEYESDDASARYRDKLMAGINRWRELRDRMKDVDREPLLFVMTEDTKSADEIVDWLTSSGGFGANEVLLIHTNAHGDIAAETRSASRQREIAALREAARDVDSERSPYRVIVSVLMLREGWDVRNVCVIVPLRPYSAASQILPEQTLGRGLRRMFPLSSGDEREELLVIEHEQFQDFWDREIEEEGMSVVMTPDRDFRQSAITVVVDQDKVPEFDIEIPRLSPRLVQKTPDLATLDITALPVWHLEVSFDGLADAPIPFETRAIDTWELVDRGEIERQFPMNEVGFLNYICRLILRECRLSNLSNTFMQLAPKVKRYIEDVLFSGQATMSETNALYRLNDASVKNWIFATFVEAVNGLSVEEREVSDERDPIFSSQTRSYLVRRRVFPRPRKSVFNNVPGDSDLELAFARWLDQRAEDVSAFAKNEAAMGFNVNYIGEMGGIRKYIPDFVIRTTSGTMYVAETKGLETTDVPRKDARMRQWCKTATELSGDDWRYVKVPERVFMDGSNWESMAQLATAVEAY